MFVAQTNQPHAIAPALAVAMTRAGRVVLALLCLTFAVLFVVGVRIFVFEYFHGDQRPLQGLIQLLSSAFNP